jgi:hypothetical protein
MQAWLAVSNEPAQWSLADTSSISGPPSCIPMRDGQTFNEICSTIAAISAE